MPRKMSATAIFSDIEMEKFFKISRLYSKESKKTKPGSVVALSRAILPRWFWDGRKDNTYNVKFIVGRFGQLLWWGQEKSNTRPYYDGVDICKDESHPRDCIVFYRDISNIVRVDPTRKIHYVPSMIKSNKGKSIPGFYKTPEPHTFYLFKFLLDWGIPATAAFKLKVKDVSMDSDPPFIDMSRIYTDYKKVVSIEIASYWKSYVTTMHHNNFPERRKHIRLLKRPFLFTENGKEWSIAKIYYRFRQIVRGAGIREELCVNSIALAHAKKLFHYTRDIDFTHQQTCVTMDILRRWRNKLPPMDEVKLNGLKFEPSSHFNDINLNFQNMGVNLTEEKT